MPLKKRRKTLKKKTTRRVLKKSIKKKAVKRVAKRKKAPVARKQKEEILGLVTHYFPKVRAAVVKLKAPLNMGDMVRIKGHTTNFTQSITSMQIDRVPINSAKRGQEIGLLVNSRVRIHDKLSKA